MPLSAGTRLGAYEIVGALGAGGMGEVYRARDLKLGREVALKILPDSFTRDPERLARFRREAQLLATLNHPNIAQIHGLNEVNGTPSLVLELVDGETLATRIARGPLSVDEALAAARQIAEALEAAHERGVIHRDLKPANIALTKDGNVKVLDFGLAKAVEPTLADDLGNSPTLTSPTMTGTGVILGTAPYMSPEQVRCKTVDRRADVWAFGCILYEMLSGRRAFPQGETVADTFAKVLETEPDWRALPALTPVRIRELIARCLRKDPRRRLHDMADARIEIEEIGHQAVSTPEPAVSPEPTRQSRRARYVVAALIAALVLTIGILSLGTFKPAPASPAVRFEVLPPDGSNFATGTGGTVSPDGRRLAFVAGNDRLIWVRPFDSSKAQSLPGTENAQPGLFWSADSQYIGFFAQSQLKKIAATGGPPQVLCNVQPSAMVGDWSADGEILIASAGGSAGPLLRLSAAGGEATPATELDASRKEFSHSYPSFLPDGRHFFFVAQSAPGRSAAYVGTFDSKERHGLPGITSIVRYSPTGHVLFLRGGSLMAQPFDARRLTLSGNAVPLAELGASPTINAPYSVSMTGTLSYRPAGTSAAPSQLAWFDRTGRQLAPVGPRAEYGSIQLSPDAKYVAFERGVPSNIWVLDIQKGVTSRLTTDSSRDAYPVWSPDGRTIVFGSNRDGPLNLYQRSFGVAGEDKPLLKTDTQAIPTDWSRDGRYLVFDLVRPGTANERDLWALPGSGDPKPQRLTQTPFTKFAPRLSPDNRWIAYLSGESGSTELYVESFLQASARQQVSTNGAYMPRWSRDGKELFYVAPDTTLMAVAIKTGSPSLEADTPKPLFKAPIVAATLPIRRDYDVAPDRHFLINMTNPAGSGSRAGTAPITVVLNWNAALK